MDPRLLEYCRANLGRFSPEQIRASLLEEGIDADEIEAALRDAAALPPPPKGPPLGPALSWMTLFLVALGGFSVLIWAVSRREHLAERRRDELAALEEEEKEEKLNKASGPSAANQPGDSLVMGYFGYSLRMPAGFETTEGLCDPQRQEETLLIHPAELPQPKVVDPRALVAGGGALLAVRPRREAGGMRDLADLRARLSPPPRRGERPAAGAEEVKGLALPAFRLRRPDGQVDTFLQGVHVFYQLTALRPGKPHDEILASLREEEPRPRMRGFVLVEDDPKKGRSYWHDATGSVITIPPGYTRLPVYTGRGLRYDFAYGHDAEPFEARLRFDPTSEQTLQYRALQEKPCFKQGRCPAADPDAPSDIWSAALAATITSQFLTFQGIPGPLAADEFNADWGVLSPGFELARSRAFNRRYRQGVLLQVHKTGVGNYFVFYLAGDAPTLNAHTNDPKVGIGIRFPAAAAR